MRKVELLPTRECEAGYSPVYTSIFFYHGYVGLIKCSTTEATVVGVLLRVL